MAAAAEGGGVAGADDAAELSLLGLRDLFLVLLRLLLFCC